METATRKTYLDGVRIFACFLAVYRYVMAETAFGSGAAHPAAQLAYALSRTAAPLAFLLVGALLLARVDSYKDTFLRVLRVVLALVLFGALHYAIYRVKTGAPFDAGALLRSVFRNELGLADSYRFLYRYLSVLVMLPILQRMTARLTRRDLAYLLLFSVGVGGLLLFARLFCPALAPNDNFSMPLFSAYIGMLALGYAIDRFLPERRGYALAAGGVGIVLAASLLLRARGADAQTLESLDRYERLGVVLAAGCLFYLLKCLDGALPLSARARAGVSAVGRLAFAAYLAFELLIDNLAAVRGWLQTLLPPYGANLVYALAVYAAGLLIAAVLTRIPLLKKLL